MRTFKKNLAKFFFFFLLNNMEKNEVEMINEQIDSGFRKA